MDTRLVLSACASALLLLGAVLTGLLIERVRPAEVQPAGAARLNLVHTVAFGLIQSLTVPLVSTISIAAVNAVGAGLIVLPESGWTLIPCFILYAFTMDLGEYLFHRAQHASPRLWLMHSMHHSDTALNASSTYRHFWAESSLKAITVYLAVGMLFRINATIASLYALLTLYNLFVHMNLRLGFGRWAWAINSPQLHRLHHSALPEHYNCNFAAIFPIFDVLFGTFRRPQPDEFPRTGITGNLGPSNLLEAIAWPACGALRRMGAARRQAIKNINTD